MTAMARVSDADDRHKDGDEAYSLRASILLADSPNNSAELRAAYKRRDTETLEPLVRMPTQRTAD